MADIRSVVEAMSLLESKPNETAVATQRHQHHADSRLPAATCADDRLRPDIHIRQGVTCTSSGQETTVSKSTSCVDS